MTQNTTLDQQLVSEALFAYRYELARKRGAAAAIACYGAGASMWVAELGRRCDRDAASDEQWEGTSIPGATAWRLGLYQP
jgi:hypothetical protein